VAGLWRLGASSETGRQRRTAGMREIVNAVCHVMRTGCAWRMLPHEFPRWDLVYKYFALWTKDGTWQQVRDQLRKQ